jgi:hypothetical protein
MNGTEEVDLIKFVAAIDKYIQKSDVPVVLVSDDMRLKSMMCSRMLVSEATPFHSGRATGDAFSFVLDVSIIQNATRIAAFSSHGWGTTSFSRVPALLAGIPYTCNEPIPD